MPIPLTYQVQHKICSNYGLRWIFWCLRCLCSQLLNVLMVLEENPPSTPPWWQVFATARVKTRHELAGDGWQYQHKVSKVFGGWFHSTKDHETGDFCLKRFKKKILFVTLLLRVLLHIIITIFMLMFLLPQLFEKKCFLCTKKHLLLILQILHLWQRFKSSNETSAHIGQEKRSMTFFSNELWASVSEKKINIS